MYASGWNAASAQLQNRVADFLKKVRRFHRHRRESARVEERALPFYGRTTLVRVTDVEDLMVQELLLLNTPGGIVLLSGCIDDLRTAHQHEQPVINAETVCAYLAYFNWVVALDDFGHLRILRELDDPQASEKLWRGRRTLGFENQTLAEVFMPPTIVEALDDGGFICAALACYGDGVSLLEFRVFVDGSVWIEEGWPLIEEPPAPTRTRGVAEDEDIPF
jgi:hypothetical protein